MDMLSHGIQSENFALDPEELKSNTLGYAAHLEVALRDSNNKPYRIATRRLGIRCKDDEYLRDTNEDETAWLQADRQGKREMLVHALAEASYAILMQWEARENVLEQHR